MVFLPVLFRFLKVKTVQCFVGNGLCSGFMGLGWSWVLVRSPGCTTSSDFLVFVWP